MLSRWRWKNQNEAIAVSRQGQTGVFVNSDLLYSDFLFGKVDALVALAQNIVAQEGRKIETD